MTAHRAGTGEGSGPSVARLHPASTLLGAVGLALPLGLSAWMCWALPEESGRFLLAAGVLVLANLVMEGHLRSFPQASVREHRLFFRAFLASMALVLLGRVAVKAMRADLIDPSWLVPAVRTKGVMVGVGMALFGNFLPKLVSPWPPNDEPFDWLRVHRFVGWIFSLTGLAVSVAWLALPIGDAVRTTLALTVVAVVLSLGRKLHSLATWRGHRRP